ARAFLNHLQRDMGMTAVYVTHDQAKAMALATRIAVMDRGRVVQYAPPLEIYRRPATVFVASFVGNPPMNLIAVEARVDGASLTLHAEDLALATLPMSPAIGQALTAGPGLTLGIRPEHLAIATDADRNIIHGRLFANEHMGPESLITIERPDASRITARLFTDGEVAVAGETRFAFTAEHIALFDAAGLRIPER